MRTLDHPNIIKLLAHGQDTEMSPSGIKKESSFMVLELAERGSLFDQVVERGAMSEK